MESSVETPSRRVRIFERAGVGFVLLTGVAFRVAILAAPVGRVDPDDAVIGLMGREFQDGRFRALFWGQNYGGTIEPILTAAAFTVMGPTRVAVKLVPIALHALGCVLVWRIGRRLVDNRTGVIAGLLAWVGPGVYLWWSTKAKGYYGALFFITLAFVLAAVRFDDEPDRRNAGVLGLVGGLCLWTSPQTALIVAPAGLWLLVRQLRPLIQHAVFGVIGFAVGSLPWTWANLESGGESFEKPGSLFQTTYGDRLELFAKSIPHLVGLRGPYRPATLLTVVIGVAFIAAGMFGLWRASRRAFALLAAIVFPYPFVFALNPAAPANELDGRYLYALAPLVLLALAAAAVRLSRDERLRWAPAALVGLLMVSSAVIPADLVDLAEADTADLRIFLVAPTLDPLVDVLEADGVTEVWGDRPMHDLTWATDERVIAASVFDERYDRYRDLVLAAPDPPAYVLVDGGGNVDVLLDRLEGLGVGAKVTCADLWVVIEPEDRIDPDEAALGISIPGAAPERCPSQG